MKRPTQSKKSTSRISRSSGLSTGRHADGWVPSELSSISRFPARCGAACRRRSSSTVKTVYLSLGSNVGDREARLREAVERLEAADVHILRRSPVYETEPQDVHEQGWFLNAALAAETELFPMQLLGCAQ